MARRRNRKFGSLITTKRMNGLGKIHLPGSFMGAALPPLVGGLVAAATAVGVRWFAKPAASAMQAKLYKFAPYVGLATGGAASLALYMLGGAPAALSGGVGALTVSGGIIGYDMLIKKQGGAAVQALIGLGAIVPEYGTRGLGAIVMEPQTTRTFSSGGGTRGLGAVYGETVNLGNVNPSAFGTPGFKV